MHADGENSLTVEYCGDEEVIQDGRKTKDFQKRPRHKMLDKGHRTRAMLSKPSIPKRKNAKGKRNGDTLGEKRAPVGVISGRRTVSTGSSKIYSLYPDKKLQLPAAHKMEVIKNGRTYVSLSKGCMCMTTP